MYYCIFKYDYKYILFHICDFEQSYSLAFNTKEQNGSFASRCDINNIKNFRRINMVAANTSNTVLCDEQLHLQLVQHIISSRQL